MVWKLPNVVLWMFVGIGLSGEVIAADSPTQIADDVQSIRRSKLTHATLGEDSRTERRVSSARAEHGRGAALGVGTPTPELPPPELRQSGGGAGAAVERTPSWIAKRAGIVLALFTLLTLAQRLMAKKTHLSLPDGMIQVCGRVPLDSKQSLRLVRIGERLLVLLETPQGIQRLAEITDPLEVRRLLGPLSQADHDLGSSDRVLSQYRRNEKSLA